MKRSLLVLFLALAALCVFFHRETLTAFPAHIHAWTQSDRFALALRFSENPNLFLPRTYNLATRDGVTAVDLPLHDWIAGVFMRLFDTRSPWVFRSWTLMLSLVGAFFFYRFISRLSGDAWRGVLAALWLFTLPVVVYYQDGFLPSAAGFALLLIAYERYFTYKQEEKPLQLITAVVLFALAALPRSPMVLFLVCAGLQELLSRRLRREHLAFVAALVFVGLWTGYKHYLGQSYGSQFLTQLTPASSWEAFRSVSADVWRRWHRQLLTVPHEVLLVGALLVALIRRFWRDQVTREVLLQAGLTFGASAAFYVAMARQFVDHEYYFLDSFYLPLLLLFAAALTSWPAQEPPYRGLLFAVCAMLLASGVEFSHGVQTQKHREEPSDLGNLTRLNFEGSGAWLDSLNVPRDARILVIDAFTTNIPLVHMGREGWTVLTTSRENIAEAMNLPWDYVVLQCFSAPSDVLYPYPELTSRVERVASNGKLILCRKGRTTEHELIDVRGGEVYAARFTLPDSSYGAWSGYEPSAVDTTGGRNRMRLAPDKEFGPTFTQENLPASVRRVYVEGVLEGAETGALFQIDLTLDMDGKRLYYRGQPFLAKDAGQQSRFMVQFLLPEHPGGAVLKTYLWNRHQKAFAVDWMNVHLLAE